MHHSDANFRGYYILLCAHKTDLHAHPWKTVLSSHQKREIYEQGVGEELLTLEAKSAGRHVQGIHTRAAHFKHGNIKEAFALIYMARKPEYSRTQLTGIQRQLYSLMISLQRYFDSCATHHLVQCLLTPAGICRSFTPAARANNALNT